MNRRRTDSAGAFSSLEEQDTGIRTLIWPLVIVLVLLVILAGTLLWHQQEKRLQERIDYHIGEISDAFYASQTQQIAIMSAELQAITAAPGLREALRSHDRKRLLALSLETGERLRQQHGLGFFYFHDLNRDNLLQVHAPERWGDRIDRWTVREAERTGEMAGGLEIEDFGAPMLRVVKPVQSDGKIIGFVELAQKAERLLEWLHREEDVQIAFSIHKKLLKQQAWERHVQTEGEDHGWGRFPDDVIAYKSVKPLPKGLLEPHLSDYDVRDHKQRFKVQTGDHLWRTAYTPIMDASGRDIGDLTVMLDVTDLQRAFRRTMAGAGALTTALLACLIYILLKKTDQRIIAQQRERYHAKLIRDLAAHREKIREAERTSIAREIHDQLGQCLTGLRLEANLLKRQLEPTQTKLMTHVTSMIAVIDTTLGAVRHITAALRPAVLDMGLVPATEWLLLETAKRGCLECLFDVDDIEECDLGEDQATALFRTIQEALTNIVRHARATRVRVTIKRLDGTLSMRIEDDGVGFDTGIEVYRGGKSFGLIGMRERALMIGGNLSIASQPGTGTIISINIPCNRSLGG